MYKRIYGRKFNRDINQRRALFKGLMRSLALNESIKTTEARAKAIKGEFESHITKAKRGEAARYHLIKHLSEDAVDRLIKDIAPKMKDRKGGYTRIVRMGARVKDNAEIVLLELVEKTEIVPVVKEPKKNAKTKVAAKPTKAAAKKSEPKSTKASEITSKVGEKKSTFKPLASIKQMVTRQKKGSS
jgi:large subunit ribosomal protein L17